MQITNQFNFGPNFYRFFDLEAPLNKADVLILLAFAFSRYDIASIDMEECYLLSEICLPLFYKINVKVHRFTKTYSVYYALGRPT